MIPQGEGRCGTIFFFGIFQSDENINKILGSFRERRLVIISNDNLAGWEYFTGAYNK